MANKYAGTQTEKNLWEAFAGESQARNKYTYFASKAKKEGYEQIAALFLKTADNEKEHAKMWFKDWAASATLLRTCCTLPRARTTSGPICMPVSLRPLRLRASRLWLQSSVWSLLSRSTMRSATVRC